MTAPMVAIPRSTPVEQALTAPASCGQDGLGIYVQSTIVQAPAPVLTCAQGQPVTCLVPRARDIPRRVTLQRSFWLQRRLPL